MPAPAPRTIKVFIASPGDLAVERRAFKDTIDDLNKGFGRGANIQFDPLGWEDALATTGRRPQSVINQDIDACDVFVLTMWRRWGQSAPDAEEKGFSSYTEEEFYLALRRWEQSGSPVIFVILKRIDPQFLTDPGEQLKKVLTFRCKLEDSRQVLYREYDDDAKFKIEITEHLIAFAEGRIAKPADDKRVALLPDSALAEIEKAKAEARQAMERAEKAERAAKDAQAHEQAAVALAEAKAERVALALAEKAAKAALDGKTEEARQDFAKALDGTTNLDVLYLGYDFFQRIGELDEAERLIRRSLAIAGPDAESPGTMSAYGNLGVIHMVRSELDLAETAYLRSLEIAKKLGQDEITAPILGNLGVIHQKRNEVESAKRLHEKSLTIYRTHNNSLGMSEQLGNLAVIFQKEGDLDRAETLELEALAITEAFGDEEATARRLGNLALINLAKGSTDRAEELLTKAITIDMKLGRLEGLILRYGNLALVEKSRGNLDEASRLLNTALDLSLKLGQLESVAISLFNLGNISQLRGNTAAAREQWTRARDLYARIGIKHEVPNLQARLDALDKPSPPAATPTP